jgi:hypothetical protein
MKIAVTVTVELDDPSEWTTTFGVEGVAAIRKDVKEYVGEGVAHMGVFGDGEVNANVSWR